MNTLTASYSPDGAQLSSRFGVVGRELDVRCADFLEFAGTHEQRYDRILMNPPFANGSDAAHILAARALLAPGGRLVALCADGPRQQEALRPIATQWEPQPHGSFSSEGTNVRVALLLFDCI